MKIAVLMSTYNGEQYIAEQIDSILAQEGDFDLELHIRDDGSKDGTINILSRYEEEGKLRWYNNENLGPAKSFMDLIFSCGEYDVYSLADQDDYWEKDKLAKAVKSIGEKTSPALYFSNAMLVDSRLESLGSVVYKKSPKIDFKTVSCAGGLLGCTMVFNNALATLLRDKGMPEIMVMHDFYIAQVCLCFDGDIVYDDACSMKYRQHGGNVVGVSYGLWGKIKSRFSEITTKQRVSIASQAKSILKLYGEDMSKEKKQWLDSVAEYRKNIFTRIKLAFSFKTRYINFNMGLKNRLSILFGNR